MDKVATTEPGKPWWKDRGLFPLVLAAVLLRLLVLAIWPDERCIRDECMYLFTANRMLDGQGMTSSNGWLWAPGYVALLAIHKAITGYAETIKVSQAILAGAAALVLARLGGRAVGHRPARLAAWMYALSPTFVFFSVRMWSESLYGTLLLLILLSVYRAREGSARWALLAGLLAGLCVLLRGVATYMVPMFAVGLLWGGFRRSRGWLRVGLMLLATVLTVAPYSIYASHKFGVLVISDRTMGQMMWLGNNDFTPITFDYGNGQLTDRAYERHAATGRPHCAPKSKPIQRDICETENGITWIKEHPARFLGRVPMRLAQLFNPNSFLTRHLRWNGFKGIPEPARQCLYALVVTFSFANVLGAALGAWGGRGSIYMLVLGMISTYHLAAVGSLAGLTRYRVPLDMLWLIPAAAFLANPLATLRTIKSSWWRVLGATLTLLCLVPLMLWYLPAGFPNWKNW